jgi:hypothetical protein
MARDLILGRTSRGWGRTGCGAYPFTSPTQDRQRFEDVQASREVGDLARDTAAEIRQNYDRVFTLTNAGKMPAADRQNFGKFLRRWQDFSMPKNGKFEGADYVSLSNFRDANRKFGSRIAAAAASRAAAPATPTPALQSGPTALPTGRLVVGLLLGLGGLYASTKIAEHVNRRQTGIL